MKRQLRFWLAGAAVVCAALALCVLLGLVVSPKYDADDVWPSTTTFADFYQLEKNSVDVLFLGSSHAMSGFDPQILYDSWGYRAYNLASEQQSVLLSRWWLSEALRCQQPKAVVLDTYFLFKYSSSPLNCSEAYQHKALDFMRPSRVRWEAVREITALDPEQSMLYYWFPLSRYHDRVSALTADDFDFSRFTSEKGLLGFAPLTTQSGDERYEPFDWNGDAEPAEMPEHMRRSLDEITRICEENDIALVLVKTPALGQTLEKSVATQQYADEHGLRFVDFNDSSVYFSELEYDFFSDNADNEHANIWGAEKMTEYIGAVLCDEYGLEAREHPYWEEARQRYEARMETLDIYD